MSFDFSNLNAGMVWNLHDGLRNDPEGVKAALRAELLKRLDAPVVTTAATTSKKEGAPETKRGRKKSDDGVKYPSLREVVRGILAKHSEGLELGGIVIEVQQMIDRKEYVSGAKSLPAVVSQALNALKQENLINHDRESRKYFNVQTAA